MEREIKGQSAIEFFVLVIAVLFVFTSLFIAVQYNVSDKTKERANLEVKEIAFTVRDEINLAFSTTDGYERRFTIPQRAANQPYDITIIGGFVYIKTDDERFAIALPVLNVTGDVRVGENLIRKQNGIVYLN